MFKIDMTILTCVNLQTELTIIINFFKITSECLGNEINYLLNKTKIILYRKVKPYNFCLVSLDLYNGCKDKIVLKDNCIILKS